MAAKKSSAKKSSAKKSSAKKSSAKKSSAKKSSAKKSTAADVRRGDLIVLDSPQVGSPPREGEVLAVLQGEVGVSYRVKWSDGSETLISPVAGSATFVRT